MQPTEQLQELKVQRQSLRAISGSELAEIIVMLSKNTTTAN